MIRIGIREYTKALQLLLVVLTCPASCLSAIQADAYKKYVLVCLKAHGELRPLPVYASHIIQRYAKSPSYVLEIAEAFKSKDVEAIQRIVEEKRTAIEGDQNMGLVKQVITAMTRQKVRVLTKTYLTLSLGEIAKEIGMAESQIGEVEALLFDMVAEDEIKARIDQTTGNVSFEEEDGELDAAMMQTLQGKLGQILELSARIGAFEQEVVTSEAYIRKTSHSEGDRAVAASGFDFMDM